jgi:enterochelin esterase-like enzyme
MDNLYAPKKAVPMILVMPYGFTSRPGEQARMRRGGSPEERQRLLRAFEDDLLKDVVPFVESHYPATADADHRALAGLSMGGGQTLRIGPPHSDTFAYLGAFSAGMMGRPGTTSGPAQPRITRTSPGRIPVSNCNGMMAQTWAET